MDIKRKTCNIRAWEKRLFLDISSTNIDTLVSLLYQCFETRSREVFWLLSQLLPHLVGHHLRFSNVLERITRASCEPLYTTNTSARKQKTFIYESVALSPFVLKKRTTERCSSVVLYTPQALSPFWLLNQHLNMFKHVCYLDCHEARTVLLPSDTHRKPITSMTDDLLPFVTYLLILTRNIWRWMIKWLRLWTMSLKECGGKRPYDYLKLSGRRFVSELLDKN
jgi:hypothetical protein